MKHWMITFLLLPAMLLPAMTRAQNAIASDSTLETPRSLAVVPSPTGAMLRSLAVPGWGQWYNHKRFKAVVIAGAEVGLVVDAIVQNQLAASAKNIYDREYYRNNRSLAIWWLGAVILYSMADAYVDAHLFDFDESTNLSFKTEAAAMPGERRPMMGITLVMRW